jgi:beta-mannosidase
MKIISLNELKWRVKGFWPWVPLKVNSMELGQELMGVTDWIPATVPGGIHYDLYRAGLIEHPYVELNSLKCEWVENRWWLYQTVIPVPTEKGQRMELMFQGLDYEAMVYVNGCYLGEHRGMYHPAAFDITDICRKDDELLLNVLLKSPPEEMGQIGKTSLTKIQKSRFNYKWDFSTRLVNIGIWDDVQLRIHLECSFSDLSVTTDVSGDDGIVNLEIGVTGNLTGDSREDAHILVECRDPYDGGCITLTRRLELKPNADHVGARLRIPHAKLWNPNGYGEQPLYTLKLTLIYSGHVADQRTLRTGLRKLEYVQNDESPEDTLPYTFVINGKKVYVKGVNMVPLDHVYGNVVREQYEWYIRLMKHAHINMVRIWGGGIIEKEMFYELCDKYGILVWQEFIQSSSGIDNIPSKDPGFLEQLAQTATHALKSRRNHVSLTVWSGGNELMSAPNTPSNYLDDNIAMLKRLVEQFDPQRLFLPTSASGPVEFITSKKGVGHDVHGHWSYQGNPKHYELYGDNDCLFHSEFGVSGLGSVKVLRKVLQNPAPGISTMKGDFIWRHHGEWWDTKARDEAMFGPLSDIKQFADCSQWIQAEGIRFILEANRRKKFRNSGSMVWQLNEPWPNISCTNLVDYFGETKMAYYWVRDAFSPVHVSLDYRTLSYIIGERFTNRLAISGCVARKDAAIHAWVYNLKGILLHEAVFLDHIPENGTRFVGELTFEIDKRFDEMFMVRLELSDMEGRLLDRNDYFFSTQSITYYKQALACTNVSITVSERSEWELAGSNEQASDACFTRHYLISNVVGSGMALHVHPMELTDGFWMMASDAYFTLLPGEQRAVTVTCIRKRAGGFAQPDIDAAHPQVVFRSFDAT